MSGPGAPAARRRARGEGCRARAAAALSVSKQTGRADRRSSAPHSSPTAAGLVAAATAGAATCRDSRVAPRGESAGAGLQALGYPGQRPAARRGRGSQPQSPARRAPPGEGGGRARDPRREGPGAGPAGGPDEGRRQGERAEAQEGAG